MNLTLLLSCIMAVLFACTGPNNTQAANIHSTVSLGDTVTEIPDSILVIFHDKKNNFWFGSNGRGVYRYNGYKLIQLTTKHGLSNNQIWEIKEDKAGNIFFTTATGIDKYDGKTITQLKVTTTNTEWKLEPGDLWFENGMDHGHPYRYDGKNLYRLTFPKNIREDEFNAKFPNTGYSPYHIYTIYTDSKGRIWFGTAVLGVGCYDGHTFKWIAEDDLTEIHDGPSNGIRSVIEDKNGDFWFSNTHYRYTISATTDGGITYKKKPGMQFPDYWLEKDGFEYLSAVVDSTGDIWMVTYNNGVFRYDFKNHYYHYYVQQADLSNAYLYTIIKSNFGTLWLGTHTDGVHKWDGVMFKKVKF